MKYPRKQTKYKRGGTNRCKISKKELKIGIPVEYEHTNSKAVATRIATDHICEFPNYYSKGLLPMEKRLKKRRLNK
jgi:hypothetical protein